MNYLFVTQKAETICCYDYDNIDDALIAFVHQKGIIDRETLSNISPVAAKVIYVNSLFKEPYQIQAIFEFTNRIYGFPEAIEYVSRMFSNSVGVSNE